MIMDVCDVRTTSRCEHTLCGDRQAVQLYNYHHILYYTDSFVLRAPMMFSLCVRMKYRAFAKEGVENNAHDDLESDAFVCVCGSELAMHADESVRNVYEHLHTYCCCCCVVVVASMRAIRTRQFTYVQFKNDVRLSRSPRPRTSSRV